MWYGMVFVTCMGSFSVTRWLQLYDYLRACARIQGVGELQESNMGCPTDTHISLCDSDVCIYGSEVREVSKVCVHWDRYPCMHIVVHAWLWM